ncbi:unnamed protein product [Musa acuminata subsp. malaccensis]|uniref:(wild Malaysian banana) hypothetical protein n=1 Tax=Musa acuminata subsp. malaccensis TaxID=214687 RepID=A0A8D7ASL9_MUSAM|nr:unnamed protein product [Musa acuminata subsp. malaccensis]
MRKLFTNSLVLQVCSALRFTGNFSGAQSKDKKIFNYFVTFFETKAITSLSFTHFLEPIIQRRHSPKLHKPIKAIIFINSSNDIYKHYYTRQIYFFSQFYHVDIH